MCCDIKRSFLIFRCWELRSPLGCLLQTQKDLIICFEEARDYFFFGQTCMFVCNTEMTTTLGKLFMQQWTTCVQAYFSLTALLLSRRKWSFVSLHFSGLYLPCPISCIIFQIHSIIFRCRPKYFLQCCNVLCSRVCNWFVKWSTYLRSSWISCHLLLRIYSWYCLPDVIHIKQICACLHAVACL